MRYLILLVLGAVATMSPPQVDIPYLGSVIGSTTTSRSGRTIYQFLGIPYAHSTSGVGRFKPPRPLEKFNSTLDATKLGQKCPEIKIGNAIATRFPRFNHDLDALPQRDSTDSEDCLNLNVFIPQLEGETQLPVFVFYHGGAFIFGSSHKFKPDYLLDNDIILVVPQYRLGPLGFLSFEVEEMPGNYGLLDQLAALQWVNKYIRYFGGNPEQVTIGGQSAGAASVSLMKYSPLAQGLFHGVIAMSGSAIASWAVDDNPLSMSPSIATFTGCSQENIHERYECLLKKPVRAFARGFALAEFNAVKKSKLSLSGVLPTLQKVGNPRYLEKDPRITLEEDGDYASVPTLTGVVKHEGIFIAKVLNTAILNSRAKDEEFLKHEVFDRIFQILDVDDSSGVFVDAIKEKYFHPHELGNLTKMWPGLIDLCGNLFMKGPVYKEASYTSDRSETYLYSFNYHGNQSSVTLAVGNKFPVTGGIDHGGELKFLFPSKAGLTKSDEVVSKKMVDLWTSFITKGKPEALGIPAWPRFSREEDVYMLIGDRDSRVEYGFVKQYLAAVYEFRQRTNKKQEISSDIS